MKTSFSILSFFVWLTLTACAPADRKLNTSGGFANPNNQSQGLRIGVYGQTIWAAQNVEQVGTLMSLCLQSNSMVKSVGNLFSKTCQLKYSTSKLESAESPQTSERWTVELSLKNISSNEYLILAANGRSQNGHTTALYRGQNTYIRQDFKSFSYEAGEEKRLDGGSTQTFRLEITSSGQIGSVSETMRYDHSVTAEGSSDLQGDQLIWNLKNVDHELSLLEKALKFNIQFASLSLNWVTPTCADFDGMALVGETGFRSSVIALTTTQARLVLEPGRRGGWSQNFKSCRAQDEKNNQKRESTILNLNFLFF